MPSVEQILLGLRETTNMWRTFAILWHVVFGVFSIALVVGWRPRKRTAGILLALPLLSVNVFAWLSSNPFNGIMFALVGVLLVIFAFKLPSDHVQRAPIWQLIPGTLLILFGWAYPHFLDSSSVFTYAYAAPSGLIPCPTLSIVIGFTLVLNRLQSRAYSLTLGIAGLLYGITGVAQLGVIIDLVLLAGALLVVVLALLRKARVPPDATEQGAARMTELGIGPQLAAVSVVYAAIALSVHFSNPDNMSMSDSAHDVFTLAGIVLVVIGLVFWALGAARIQRAFKEERLLTDGVFAVVRNPMYCGFIAFVTPGIALWLRSWPLLTLPFMAYIVFKLLVGREEKYLEEKFGPEFREYRSRVNAIIPFLHLPR